MDGAASVQFDIESMGSRVARASQLLAAMANEKRLLILCQLVTGERTVGELAALLGVRQSTVSQHLALLRKDGLVESRREGQSQYYSLAGNEARDILEALHSLYCEPVGRGAQA